MFPMDNKRKRKVQNREVLDKEIALILQEAAIVARWNNKPFYIS